MRIWVLEHEPESPPGLFGEWADARGHSVTVFDVPRLDPWPDPGEADLIVSLGSDESVHASTDSWIAEEIAFVQKAESVETPVLGICFGGQLLAWAHGGAVHRATAARAQWGEVRSTAPELLHPGPWFRWHEDVFELPTGATLLAGDEHSALAFATKRSLGLQFHPEVSREIAEGWIDGGRRRLHVQGIDEAQLRKEIDRYAPRARPRAFDLFDAFGAWLWRGR